MKVALVHDYIKEYGGAERVLEALHEMWPDAPVFTIVYLPEFLGPHRGRFKNWNIKTSIAQYLPFKAKLISPLRLLAPFLFKTFDFSKFDVVIVSATGAYSPNTISQRPKTKDQKPVYLCYCHTPPRYLYGYMTAREWKKIGIVRVVGEVMNHFLRLIDFKSAQNVDFFIANSEEVRLRIKKFYRKDAVVIYPPVDVARGPVAGFPPASAPPISSEMRAVGSPSTRATPRSYYLAGGRLARAKGIDIIIEAFVKLKKPLKVFGKSFGGYEKEIKNQKSKIKITIQKSKVEFVGEVSDEEKVELMRNAKAYVFASYDEDFGITPVEAMSVGTPVIAYRSGGVQESVVDPSAGSGQATGVLYNENTPEELAKAVQKFEHLAFDPQVCIKQAQKFSKERFKKEIKEFVASITYKKQKKD